MNLIKNNKCIQIVWQTLLALLVFALCSAPAFLKAGVGAGFFDEPYQILNGLNFRSTPLSALSSFLTNFWGNLFEWKWLYFRYLAIAINTISILIGGLILLCYSRKYWDFLLVTAGVILIGTLFPLVQNLYGWDSWTELFVTASIATLFIYMRRPSVWLVIALGVLAALTTMARIPNGIIIPVEAACILFLNPLGNIVGKKRVGNVIVFACVSLICIFILIILLFESLGGFVYSLEHNSIGSHGIRTVLYGYLRGFILTLPACGLMYLVYLAIDKSRYFAGKIGVLIVALAGIIIFMLNIGADKNPYFSSVSGYSIAISFFGLAAVWYFGKDKIFTSDSAFGIMLFCMACVPFFGSNTEIAKFLCWPILPIIWLLLLPNIKSSMSIFAAVFVAAVLCYATYGLQAKSFFDVGLRDATYTLSEGVVSGIKTSPEIGGKIQKIYDAYKPYSGDEIERITLRRSNDYLLDYLFMTPNQFLGSQFDIENGHYIPEYVEWVREKIRNSSKPVAILFLKGALNSPDRENEPSLMQQMLNDEMTPQVIEEDFIIYIN